MRPTDLRCVAALVAVSSMTAAASLCTLASLAEAVCDYGGLPNGVVQTISTTPQFHGVQQDSTAWMAVGIRSKPGDDWDIRLHGDRAPEPECAANLLGSSTATTGVDFVVGDYNHNPVSEEVTVVNRFSGSQTATMEWDGGKEQVYVNGPYTQRNTSTNDVLEAWDIALIAGRTYTFEFITSAANCKLLLFRNPANAPFWAARSSRVFETSTTGTYTAPATDVYGLVVVNDDGVTGLYSFRVKTCVTPVPLTSGSVVTINLPQTTYSFAQAPPYWSVVGVRQPSSDWDIGAYSGVGAGPYPACLTTILASSTQASGTDFIIGDFNQNPTGTYYVDAFPNSGSALTAALEWDGGPDQVFVNGPIVSRNTGPTDVLEVWDVNLTAGTTYTIEFAPTGAELSYLLFENPGTGTYWARRSEAVLSSTATSVYTPTRSGYHGLVVLNNNGAAGSYTLRAGTCTAPVSLAIGAPAITVGSVSYFKFSADATFWGAVGVRQTSGNWDLDVWGNGAGGWPFCFSNHLANSTGAGTVDFVVGDFNHNTVGTYFVRPYYTSGTSFDATVEWDGGGDQIVVDGPLVSRTTGGLDVLETWDVFLLAGTAYDLFFARNGSANTKLLLYHNNGATYWAPRSSRVLETTATHTSYTAPTTDFYGVVVANDNGQNGTYKLGIAKHVSDAGDEGSPEVTALRRVGPNPSHGPVEVGFDLREPASVAIRVMDAAGRLVATLPQRQWPAGHWTTSWDGTDASGKSVAAGVYYVRVSAADREIGRRKVVVLR